jgi:tetratricopeptide (TPR) repeat protein
MSKRLRWRSLSVLLQAVPLLLCVATRHSVLAQTPVLAQTGILAQTGLMNGNVTASKGLEAFYNLDFATALANFRADVKANPTDAAAFNRLAYAVLYYEMFRNGALETQLVTGNNPFLRRSKMEISASDQAEFDGALNKALSLTETALAKNPKDPQALYARGVTLGFRANYNFLVKKAWREALKDATEGRKLHNQVVEMNPQNIDAQLMQGLHDYVIGSLPWTWKALGFLVGFRGNKEEGIKTLDRVARQGAVNKYDAQVLLATIYRRERRAAESIPLLQGLIQRFPKNFLMRLELGQMYSDLGKRNEALASFRSVRELKAANTPGYENLLMEKIFYYEGNLYFWYNEPENAIEELKKAAAKANQLDLNTGIYAWLRLGQSYDLKGNRSEAKKAYDQVIALAPTSEAAKEAREFSNTPYKRARVG